MQRRERARSNAARQCDGRRPSPSELQGHSPAPPFSSAWRPAACFHSHVTPTFCESAAWIHRCFFASSPCLSGHPKRGGRNWQRGSLRQRPRWWSAAPTRRRTPALRRRRLPCPRRPRRRRPRRQPDQSPLSHRRRAPVPSKQACGSTRPVLQRAIRRVRTNEAPA